MVCIIDDREDVWNFAPNLVHVKPYIFFKNVGDINAPEKQPQQQEATAKNKEGGGNDNGKQPQPNKKAGDEMKEKCQINSPKTSSKNTKGEHHQKDGIIKRYQTNDYM